MIELLSALYEYVKSGKSPLLEKSEHINKYEHGTIYTMSLSLILWLRLEYKRTEWRKEKKYVTLKPMSLNMKYPWCQALNDMVTSEEIFSQYFCIIDNKLEFKDSVPEEERMTARKWAYDNFYMATMT